jgi:hypothetical protein
VSKKTREFFEQVRGGEPPKGAIEAIKEGVQKVLPGLSLGKMLDDIGSELGRLGVQGQMEMASALFNGSAFVPYGPGQYTPSEIDHGVAHEDPPQKEPDGREM